MNVNGEHTTSFNLLIISTVTESLYDLDTMPRGDSRICQENCLRINMDTAKLISNSHDALPFSGCFLLPYYTGIASQYSFGLKRFDQEPSIRNPVWLGGR
ncbi:hypothetical protein EVAR_29171_1 [Eumeta japonica]|uniref:Uncharacterized protein n=1 Tax=Eumeta variegata TaxID=151549 RepID=A0A4C1VB11_EUMVA|nr:hypothetical protein EVAR_29171_1 [Eumeta japonica]